MGYRTENVCASISGDSMGDNENRDIFDRLASHSIFERFYPFYKKYKEKLLYLFFGGLTVCVGLVSFAIFESIFGMNVLMANVFSWCSGATFAFFTNRKWVFPSHGKEDKPIWEQMLLFYSGRLATLFIQEALLYALTAWAMWSGMLAKLVTELLNIVLNYVLSKTVVFRKKA